MSRYHRAPFWLHSKQTMNKTDLSGLYIHIPFCRSKCPYCDFYSRTETDLVDDWVSACLPEARIYRDHFEVFDSLYLGGGTPSLLAPDQIARLVAGIRSLFSFDESTEFTIELNPDDVTKDKLDLYKSLGINRVSIGAQSFDDDEVRFLGRRHTARQALTAIEAVIDKGFAEFSIDLMYGLPDQSIDIWIDTLRKVVAFRPDHLSCYQLTLEGDTVFSRQARREVFRLPDDSRQADFFLGTSEYLTQSGYVHYEVSNFARDEKKLARHNTKYWQHTPYLGLGPSAHSFLKGERWWNDRDLKGYIAFLKDNRVPGGGRERLSSDQMSLERLLFGSRTMWGFDVRDIVPGPSQGKIDRLCDSGLIICRDWRIIPTLKGYLFADKLPLMVS